MDIFTTLGPSADLFNQNLDTLEKINKINKINDKQDFTKCKYCKKKVKFLVVDITKDPKAKQKLHWTCINPSGVSHSSVCLGNPEYKPKFQKGDTIISQWKEHKTIYIVTGIDDEEGVYNLRYQKKRHGRNSISIKTIDKKSIKCDGELVEAIFG